MSVDVGDPELVELIKQSQATVLNAKCEKSLTRYLLRQLEIFQHETSIRLAKSQDHAKREALLADSREQLLEFRKDLHLEGMQDFQNFFRRLEVDADAFTTESLIEHLDESPLSQGLVSNVFQFSPLHIVCRHNRLSLIQPLLLGEVSLSDRSGAPFYATPLILAIQSGAQDAVEFLLNLSQDHTLQALGKKEQINTPDGTDLANTPLIYAVLSDAVYADNAAVPKFYDNRTLGALLKVGAKVNQQNRQGRTPLHYAMLYQDFALAHYLISKGADLYCQDNQGLTPFHLSLLSDEEVINELEPFCVELSIRPKKVKTLERHQSLFLHGLKEEQSNTFQNNSMSLLMKLSLQLDDIYARHQALGGNIAKTEFYQKRRRLSHHFNNFTGRIDKPAIMKLIKDFIATALSNVEYKIEIDKMEKSFNQADKNIFQIERQPLTQSVREELARRAYRNEALQVGSLKKWLKSFRSDVPKKERLKYLFWPIGEGSNDLWLSQAFFSPSRKFNLESQISFTEQLSAELLKEGLLAEWVNLQSFRECLKALKPLKAKIIELEKDYFQLAKEKSVILSTFYLRTLELSFNLFQENQFALSPSEEQLKSFLSGICSYKEILLTTQGVMLDKRRNHLLDGLKTLFSLIIHLFNRLLRRPTEKKKEYLGSRQAMEITEKNYREVVKRLDRCFSRVVPKEEKKPSPRMGQSFNKKRDLSESGASSSPSNFFKTVTPIRAPEAILEEAHIKVKRRGLSF